MTRDQGVMASQPQFAISRHAPQRGGCFARDRGCRLFFHSGDVLGMFMCAVTVQRRTDAQEELECVAEIVPVVAVESVGTVVDGELRAESDIYPLAVR